MKFLRMKPGHGEVLIAEGDVDVAADEERLVEEFRRQLDHGLWAAVPNRTPGGRREARVGIGRHTEDEADRPVRIARLPDPVVDGPGHQRSQRPRPLRMVDDERGEAPLRLAQLLPKPRQ